MRKEVRLLAEFLTYGLQQVEWYAPTLKTDTEQEKGRIERAYDAGMRDAIGRVAQAITDLYGYKASTEFLTCLNSVTWLDRKNYNE